LLIRGAELEGRRVDLRIRGATIAEIAPELEAQAGEAWIEARGGALLPGLHDHHLHLLALAAALRSLRCGPPQVTSARELAGVLGAAARAAAAGEVWLRGVGYHESVAGPLARDALDRFVSDRPLRIQHRTGALWMLNSAAISALGLDAGRDAPGVERDAAGRATGRLYRCDEALRAWLPDPGAPDLREVGARLARVGVCGVTDATPHNAAAELSIFARAQSEGLLPQRVLALGARELPEPGAAQARLARGARKLVLREDALPELDALVAEFRDAHAQGRAVAIHCVTRAELVLAAAALELAGSVEGDRIEHASIAPPDAVALVARLRLTVVTQPNFACERGDAYLDEVDARDRAWLYRGRTWLDAGVALGGGTDAPYGEPDPWAAMRAAVQRRTASGRPIGPAEAITPERALALFTSSHDAPGGAPRDLAVGTPADVCLLAHPWAQARHELSAASVRATFCAGALAYASPEIDRGRT
jgi:predicted amidohydrolase YtcJ